MRKAIGTGIISPVKPAHLEWAVICAISCTDTTVVSHLVKPFSAMVGCTYRAHILTRGVIAVLAHQRLKHHCWVVNIAAVITVNAHPVHFVKARYFPFTYNRYIIFCITSNNAGAATHAGVKVNAHAPMDAWFVIYRVNGAVFFVIFNAAKWFQLMFAVI